MLKGLNNLIRFIMECTHDKHLGLQHLAEQSEDSKVSLERLTKLTDHLDSLERDLWLHEEILKMGSNSLKMPVWGKDLDGKFIFLNDACARWILGVSVQEALNLTDEDFKHDALAPICMTSDRIVIETMQTHRFIEYAKYADHQIWIESLKSPWVIRGELVGTVGSARVLTDLIPDDVKRDFPGSGLLVIPIDLMYCKDDIRRMLKDYDRHC